MKARKFESVQEGRGSTDKNDKRVREARNKNEICRTHERNVSAETDVQATAPHPLIPTRVLITG